MPNQSRCSELQRNRQATRGRNRQATRGYPVDRQAATCTAEPGPLMTSVAAEALPAQRLAHPLGQAVKNGVRDLSGEETIVMNLNNCHELDYGLFSGTENDLKEWTCSRVLFF